MVYVRDDRNAGSQMPPAVWFAYSPDRERYPSTKSPGRLQRCAEADAYGGYRALYESGRITEAAGMAHAGEKSTMCMQERPPTSPRKPCSVSVNCMPSRQRSGASAEQRLAARKARAAPLMQSLYDWIQQQMKTLSRHSDGKSVSHTR